MEQEMSIWDMDTTTMSTNVPSVEKSTTAKKCVKQCKADPTRKYCVGCLRTMEEIVACGVARKRLEAS